MGTGGPWAQSVPSARFCCEPRTARQIGSIFKNRRGQPLSKWVSPEATRLREAKSPAGMQSLSTRLSRFPTRLEQEAVGGGGGHLDCLPVDLLLRERGRWGAVRAE